MNQHDHNSDLSRTVFIILEPFDSKYATQFLTRLHAGAAPAKNEEGGGILFLIFSCLLLFPFIVQNIQVYFLDNDSLFSTFSQKKRAHS